MKAALRKSTDLPDWFVADGAEFGQPEGNAFEWAQILDSMERRENESFRLLGVRFDDELNAQLYSPQNAAGADDYALILDEQLDDWVAAARKTLTDSKP